jgi:hypothetical protein
MADGVTVGTAVGLALGLLVGLNDGSRDGFLVGSLLGDNVQVHGTDNGSSCTCVAWLITPSGISTTGSTGFVELRPLHTGM